MYLPFALTLVWPHFTIYLTFDAWTGIETQTVLLSSPAKKALLAALHKCSGDIQGERVGMVCSGFVDNIVLFSGLITLRGPSGLQVLTSNLTAVRKMSVWQAEVEGCWCWHLYSGRQVEINLWNVWFGLVWFGLYLFLGCLLWNALNTHCLVSWKGRWI